MSEHTISTLFGEEEVVTHYCKKCKTWKPIFEFTLRDRASNGMRPYNSCKSCDDLPKHQMKNLKKCIPKPESDHVCPICLRGKEELTGYTSSFVLEHDHITGEFRGWVCHDCNTAISRIRDDADTAVRMSAYLRKSNN